MFVCDLWKGNFRSKEKKFFKHQTAFVYKLATYIEQNGIFYKSLMYLCRVLYGANNITPKQNEKRRKEKK